MRQARAVLSAFMVAAALSGCVGIGAVPRGAVTAEAQNRGGGVTGALVGDALAAVADETGMPDAAVVSVTATLATVVVVVVDADDDLVTYRYGTSGLYGGKGLEEQEVTPGGEVPPATFPASAVAADAFDAAVDRARAAAPAGAWVESVTLAPGEGPPRATVLLHAGVEQVAVEEVVR